MIYIDHPPHNNGWCHLFADSIDELHDFAGKAGINKCWFENKKGRYSPHYDVREKRLQQLITAGAKLVNWRATPEMLRERYKPWKKPTAKSHRSGSYESRMDRPPTA